MRLDARVKRLESLAGSSGWSEAAEQAWTETKAASAALKRKLGFSPEASAAPPGHIGDMPDESAALSVAGVPGWINAQQPGESDEAFTRRLAWQRLSARGQQQEAERARRQVQQEARRR